MQYAIVNETTWWKQDLTSAEVTELYNDGKYYNVLKHSRKKELVSWWTFGDDGDDKATISKVFIVDKQHNAHLESIIPNAFAYDTTTGFVNGGFAFERGAYMKLKHDNMYINTPIPRSEFQYSWITASLGNWSPVEQKILGYGPKEGFYSSSVEGFVLAINFPTASEIFGSD